MTTLTAVKCLWCRQPLDNYTFSREHIIPKALGGDDSPENVRPACRACNGDRGLLTGFALATARMRAAAEKLESLDLDELAMLRGECHHLAALHPEMLRRAARWAERELRLLSDSPHAGLDLTLPDIVSVEAELTRRRHTVTAEMLAKLDAAPQPFIPPISLEEAVERRVALIVRAKEVQEQLGKKARKGYTEPTPGQKVRRAVLKGAAARLSAEIARLNTWIANAPASQPERIAVGQMRAAAARAVLLQSQVSKLLAETMRLRRHIAELERQLSERPTLPRGDGPIPLDAFAEVLCAQR